MQSASVSATLLFILDIPVCCPGRTRRVSRFAPRSGEAGKAWASEFPATVWPKSFVKSRGGGGAPRGEQGWVQGELRNGELA